MSNSVRCEGWRRRGGAFTFGPVTWKQCENNANVFLDVLQDDDEQKSFPACVECWEEADKNDDVIVVGVTLFKGGFDQESKNDALVDDMRERIAIMEEAIDAALEWLEKPPHSEDAGAWYSKSPRLSDKLREARGE